jgi:integrase
VTRKPAAQGTVTVTDLYRALLEDAPTEVERGHRADDINILGRFLDLSDPSDACAALVLGGASGARAIAVTYQCDLLELPIRAATFARRMNSVRRVLDLARALGLISWSITIEPPAVASSREKRLGARHAHWLRLIYLAQESARRSPLCRRDVLIFRLLYHEDLARSEVAALDLADVDLNAGRLFLPTRQAFSHTYITLSQPTLKALKDYLAYRGREPGPLFVRSDSNRPGGVLTRFNRCAIDRRVALAAHAIKRHHKVWLNALRHKVLERLIELHGDDPAMAQQRVRAKSWRKNLPPAETPPDLDRLMRRLLGQG